MHEDLKKIEMRNYAICDALADQGFFDGRVEELQKTIEQSGVHGGIPVVPSGSPPVMSTSEIVAEYWQSPCPQCPLTHE